MIRIEQQVWCWQQLPASIEQEIMGKNPSCTCLHRETIKLSMLKLFLKVYAKELERQKKIHPLS